MQYFSLVIYLYSFLHSFVEEISILISVFPLLVICLITQSFLGVVGSSLNFEKLIISSIFFYTAVKLLLLFLPSFSFDSKMSFVAFCTTRKISAVDYTVRPRKIQSHCGYTLGNKERCLFHLIGKQKHRQRVG